MSAAYHIGTQGWSYPDWTGPFYPEGTASPQYLSVYAKAFSAVEIDSSSARAHFHLGLVLDSSGRPTEARHHYEQAVELDPSSRAGELLTPPRPGRSQ